MSGSSVSASPNGVIVITQVIPAGSGIVQTADTAARCPALPLGHAASSVLERFRKGEPISLGTVQIMVGICVALVGAAIAALGQTLSVLSGIFIWGATIYIIAGSLTVAAGRTLNKCLVKGSLGVNVVAAVVSLTAFILCALDAAGVTFYYCYDYPGYSHYCFSLRTQTQVISGVLALFSLLEFTVSISVSAFGCKATCYSEPQVFIVGNQFAHGNTEIPVISNPPFNTYETMINPGVPEEHGNPTPNHMDNQPPKYTVHAPNPAP